MKNVDGNTRVQQKTFFHRLVILGLIISIFASVTSASAESLYEIRDDLIIMTDGRYTNTCKLDVRPLYAVESYDASAIIISERGYVQKSQLYNCADSVVHVALIPAGVGFLSDINIRNGIYVSLDLISSPPLRYLATVAKIGVNKNLISLSGAYKEKVDPSRLRKYGFSSIGEAGASIISLDGKYVAPNGLIDCSDAAYPGIWDIQRNRRVKADEKSCADLFSKK
ncbi:hypothetical protein [Cupriavidus necator]|uniref:hypothetical protein n=1 Tax=Cupriavidus necator TaxID=106590 RepID=UPI0030F3AAF0